MTSIRTREDRTAADGPILTHSTGLAGSAWWCELAVVGGRVERGVTVVVDDGRFTSVTVDSDPADGVERLSGITIPGLANAHSHAFHRALRSHTQADGGTFWTWREVMYRAADRLDPDRYFRLARATFAEMALTGVTTVGEFHYLHHQPDGTPYDDANDMGRALITAADEAGLRITLLDTLYLHGGLDAGSYVPARGVQRRFADASAAAWAERVGDLPPGDRHRVGAAIHSVRAVDPTSMRSVAELATTADAPLHAHVSEQPAENEHCQAAHDRSPTAVLRDAGALDARFTAVHATHLSDADIDQLAGSTVCMCPTTERDLGDGIGPTPELVAAGSRLSLGSDSHAVIDLFEEARALELDERLRSRRRGVHSAAALLDAATVAGHRCLGWDGVGTIAAGQRADLVTVTLGSVRTAGWSAATALETVLFAATASDVTDVIIDGRRVVSDGRHATIDVAAELHGAITDLMGA